MRSVFCSFVVSPHAVAKTRRRRARGGGLQNRSIAMMIAVRHSTEKLSGRRTGIHGGGGKPHDLSPLASGYTLRIPYSSCSRIDVAINPWSP
jgi:hypothetical protein